MSAAATLTGSVSALVLVATLLGAAPSEAADPTPTLTPTPTATPTGLPTATATATPTGTPTPTPTATPTKLVKPPGEFKPGKKFKTPDRYTPKDGVRFNDPVSPAAAKKRKLLGQLLRTINSVPRGEEIRIASWNIRSSDIADALIAAYHRGVSVQAVMDNVNAKPDNRNVPVNRMIGAFAPSRQKKPPARRSSVIKCLSSCRSTSGIAHTKFFLFSRAGKATDVVMFGSNNATDLAAYYQWNDLYTVVDDSALYAEFDAVFAQMRKDKAYKQPYLSFDHPELTPPLTTYFYPYAGEVLPPGDPVTSELDKVECDGATDGTGTDGKTKIRIAQTAVLGTRGKAIATKLRQLYQDGCDIKIVYAVLGNGILDVVRHTTRGAIPIRQIAQDFNLDGVYDRYLHMKDLTISGVYDGNTAAQVTFNGSANYTSVGLASDEIVGKVVDPGITTKYSNWIDHLYGNPPRFRGRLATFATLARMSALTRGVSPESGIEED